MKVCIDAGHNHSGYDTGAQGNGLKEQDVTFFIADKLKSLLEGENITVVMTRPALSSNTDNSSINASLTKRSQFSNSNNCDLFVSIHCNAGGGTGTECYAYSEKSAGYALAGDILKNLTEKLPLRNRGVKTADFAVLRLTNCPAVLLETAFIDNYNDSIMLKNNQNDFAGGIASGIFKYLGIQPKSEITIAEMKACIASICGFSSPDGVFGLLDTHMYASDLYKKWYESYKK